MTKKLGLLLATLLMLGFSNVQASEFSVAVVDVPQVVGASAQVQALKKEQETKAKDIIKYVETARKNIASITDATKKKAEEEKYSKELQTKKEKMDKEYAEKLKAIDTSITQQIVNQAKLDGYNLVLSKGVVLYGGTDITAKIIKVVK